MEVKYENLANRYAELIIEFAGSVREVHGEGVPVHFNGFLNSSDELNDLKVRLTELLSAIDKNLDLYSKVGDFSTEWNALRHSEIDLAQRIEARNLRSLKIKEKRSGFVYLMKDEANGTHKIGFSKDPKFREQTLQSEKPSIVLIGSFSGTMSDEKLLHEQLSEYRLRGEWFRLPDGILQILYGQFI